MHSKIIYLLFSLLFFSGNFAFGLEEVSFEGIKVIENGKEYIMGYRCRLNGMKAIENGEQFTIGYDDKIRIYIPIDTNLMKVKVTFCKKRSPVKLSYYPSGTSLEFHGNILGTLMQYGSGYEYALTDISHDVEVVIKDREYLVKRGDKLWDIAKKVMDKPVGYKIIAALNNIKNANNIKAGSILYLPIVHCLMVWVEDEKREKAVRMEYYEDYMQDECFLQGGFRPYYGRKMFSPSCLNSEQCSELEFPCKDLSQTNNICEF